MNTRNENSDIWSHLTEQHWATLAYLRELKDDGFMLALC